MDVNGPLAFEVEQEDESPQSGLGFPERAHGANVLRRHEEVRCQQVRIFIAGTRMARRVETHRV